MKKIWPALLCLLILCGCGKEYDRAEEVQQRFANLASYDASVRVSIPHEDETIAYTLHLSMQGDTVRAAVSEPEELALVGAVLTGEKLALTFDDLVLDAGTLSPRVSALNCVPLILRAFPKAYLDSSGTETLGDTDALRADFSLTLGSETLACTLWFDEADAPVYAEIAENDKIIAAAEFTNFVFGDILPPSTQN